MDTMERKEILKRLKDLEERAKELLSTEELKKMDAEFREEAKEVEEGIAGKRQKKR